MARFRRKDLKRPDPFMSTSRNVIDWAIANQRQVAIGAAVVLVIGVAIAAVVSNRITREVQANEELAQGLALLSSNRYAEAAIQLSQVSERWSGSTAGIAAELYASHAQIQAKNTNAAIAGLDRLVKEKVSPAYLSQQAVMVLAYANEQGGDLGKAGELYAQARKGEGPYGGMALLGEARCRDGMGDKPKAIELYQSFLDEYPTSKDQEYVSSRLSELKGV